MTTSTNSSTAAAEKVSHTVDTVHATRPASSADLPDYQRQGQRLFSFGTAEIAKAPTVGVHLLQALNEVNCINATAGLVSAPYVVEADGSTVNVHVRPTPAELDRHLDRAQESWDRSLANYRDAVTDPSSQSPAWRTILDSWAREVGLPRIDWTAAL